MLLCSWSHLPNTALLFRTILPNMVIKLLNYIWSTAGFRRIVGNDFPWDKCKGIHQCGDSFLNNVIRNQEKVNQEMCIFRGDLKFPDSLLYLVLKDHQISSMLVEKEYLGTLSVDLHLLLLKNMTIQRSYFSRVVCIIKRARREQ
jgi:hypothetical protein